MRSAFDISDLFILAGNVIKDDLIGNDEVMARHVYGGVPPVAAKLWEYDVPTIPTGREDPVDMAIGGTGELMVNVNAF